MGQRGSTVAVRSVAIPHLFLLGHTAQIISRIARSLLGFGSFLILSLGYVYLDFNLISSISTLTFLFWFQFNLD